MYFHKINSRYLSFLCSQFVRGWPAPFSCRWQWNTSLNLCSMSTSRMNGKYAIEQYCSLLHACQPYAAFLAAGLDERLIIEAMTVVSNGGVDCSGVFFQGDVHLVSIGMPGGIG